MLLGVGVLAATVLSLAGCVGQVKPTPQPAAPPRPAIAGLWEGLTRATVPDGPAAGDTRIERQLWKLTQQGETVTGFCVVELTMISGDGRPYLCSQEPQLRALIRVEVKGRVTPEGARIDEVSAPQTQGPCAVGLRAPRSFQVKVRGNLMVLSDGTNQLSLTRRPSSAGDENILASLNAGPPPSATQPSPSRPRANVLAAQEDGPLANAEGYWLWEHSGTVAGGDEKSEREEWHLVQEGDRISGHYDRWVRQVSMDGHPFRCSGALEFRVGTRYRVTGEVRGNSITIYERGYEVLEGEACDQSRHRLDAYQGRVDSEEIRLLWGTGVQVLRRGRPDVPTQRF